MNMSFLKNFGILAAFVLTTACAGSSPSSNRDLGHFDGYSGHRDYGYPVYYDGKKDTTNPYQWDSTKDTWHSTDGQTPYDTIHTITDTTVPYDLPATPVFYDVTGGVYRKAIEWVYSHGYMEPCASNPLRFCPTSSITRSIAAKAVAIMKYGANITGYSTTPCFADVPTTHSEFKYIQKLCDAQIIDGYPGGTSDWLPGNAMKRSEAATMITKAKFGPTFANTFTPSQADCFTDVNSTQWWYPYIQKMCEAKITSGCGNDLFCPSDNALRQEFAAFLHLAQTL